MNFWLKEFLQINVFTNRVNGRSLTNAKCIKAFFYSTLLDKKPSRDNFCEPVRGFKLITRGTSFTRVARGTFHARLVSKYRTRDTRVLRAPHLGLRNFCKLMSSQNTLIVGQ